MTRYLARRIEHAGKIYTLSIVEALIGSDGLWYIKIEPFEHEIHSTSYHNGTLRIVDSADSSKPFSNGSPYPPLFLL